MKKKIFITIFVIAAAFGLFSDTVKYARQLGASRPVSGSVAMSKESLTYLYAGTTASYLKMLDDARGSIKTVCTDYFDIKPDGSLWITPAGKIDAGFIDEMHARGMLVTPFISNHWDREKGNAALDNRAALTDEIAEMISKYNLDGINIDIENVNEKYRDAYTDFARLLRKKLPKNKIVAVAVAANPKGWNTGWHGSYDYKALADESDYLMIMTYDESYFGSEAGPVAGKAFFDDSIKYALGKGVPKSKIVAGLPFYGRAWKAGDAVSGFGITANDIEYLIKNYASAVRYDKSSESANAVITITPGDPKPVIWGGRVLGEGVYDIWYDDHQALKYKLKAIDTFGIKGAGSWSLGQEDTQIWDFYATTLNGTVVTIPEPEPESEPEIETPVKTTLDNMLDILNKGNARKVKPETLLTRGEAAVLISEMAYVKPEKDGEAFADTAKYWGAPQLNALKRRGIICGDGSNLFRPDSKITREEIIAIFDRVLVLPNTIDYRDMTFTDVKPDMWSYPSIAKLYYFELVYGYSRDFFMPYENISAATLSLIFERIAKNDYPMNPDRFLSDDSLKTKAIPEEAIIEPR